MALSEFRDTCSWQGAIALGTHLAGLADELPAAEQLGLALHLRNGMVDLPAAIALDLAEEGSYTRRGVALRLVAVIDLIDHVYPALDTAKARGALEELIERLAGKDFAERKTPKRPAHHQDADTGAHGHSHPEPASVPVIGESPATSSAPAAEPSAAPDAEQSAAAVSATSPQAPDASEHDAPAQTASQVSDDHTNPALKVPVMADLANYRSATLDTPENQEN